MKKGKRYSASAELVDRTKLYETKEGIELALKTANAKFDETMELHVRLGVDGRNADQQVRGVVVLPNGTGKTVRVLVIAKGENADIATANGADFVGAEDMIAKIQGGWTDFDACVTTPDMMAQLGRVAKILGPKGLMPSPKSGTVTTDIKKALNDITCKLSKCVYNVNIEVTLEEENDISKQIEHDIYANVFDPNVVVNTENKKMQENHGFNVGDAIYFDTNDNMYKKSIADNSEKSQVYGVVTEVPGENVFAVLQYGIINYKNIKMKLL